MMILPLPAGVRANWHLTRESGWASGAELGPACGVSKLCFPVSFGSESSISVTLTL